MENGDVKMLNTKIKQHLLREGVHEDAVKSLDEKGKCLFDINSTRDVCFEFIDEGVKFSCEQCVLDNSLYLIKILH
ncbi:hypothetical protein [Clostridium sp.]|uniref:hypothetical protein n=1 Tax=Clostridium sp. TaxID=1506 RepID=UPI003D6CFE70